MKELNYRLEDKSVVVYWDHQNIQNRNYHNFSLAEDLVSYAREEGKIAKLEVYADWTLQGKKPQKILRNAGFRLIQVLNCRRNIIDFEITTELGAIATDRGVDVVILITSDGDFISAINHLKRSGKKVSIIGNPAISNKDLIKVADKYIPVDSFPSWRSNTNIGKNLIKANITDGVAKIS